MEWLPVWIKGGTELREYAIPHFIEALDVIDRERSVLNRVTGDVIKAHLRMDAIDGHEVFTYSNEIWWCRPVLGNGLRGVEGLLGVFILEG